MSFRDEIRAAKAIGSGDQATQIDIYERILETEPKDFAALAHLARCYERAGNSELSIGFANRALDEIPTNFTMLIHVAKYWARLENDERAYSYCCRAVDSGPDSIRVPSWVFRIFGLLSFIPKFRGLEKKAADDQAKHAKREDMNFQWALGYKLVYESRLAKEHE